MIPWWGSCAIYETCEGGEEVEKRGKASRSPAALKRAAGKIAASPLLKESSKAATSKRAVPIRGARQLVEPPPAVFRAGSTAAAHERIAPVLGTIGAPVNEDGTVGAAHPNRL